MRIEPARMRNWLARRRPNLDAEDLTALRLMVALGAIIAGVWMIYVPAALIVGGLGYLGLGLYRRWL